MEPKRGLRMVFFLDYEDGMGGRFINSPGLLPLIGSTRAAGFDVDFIVTEAELLAALEFPAVDVVGISSMERLLPRSISVAKKVKQRRPDVILMIGGNAIDPFAVELAAGLFDLVVLGESELVLPALLRAIARAKGLLLDDDQASARHVLHGPVQKVGETSVGGALDKQSVESILSASFVRSTPEGKPIAIRVGNVYVRDSMQNVVWYLEEPHTPDDLLALNGALGSTNHPANFLSSAPLREELDDLCILPWDVLAKEGWKHFEFYTQRGCRWGQCNFCSVADRQIRALSPAKAAEVIADAVKQGAEMVSFADDLFVQHQDWNRELFKNLLERNVQTSYRAQTMANRMVWPLLDMMYHIGFSELAFGVETLSPERAEFMAKSFNGQKYVENAIETVRRTAAAGIHPVLYMIMVDPNSTLLKIAEELKDTAQFVDYIYHETSVVPKLSYSLMMLPVACTSITAQFAYNTETIPLPYGQIQLPTEFQVSLPVSNYLRWIDQETAAMAYRRENLSALMTYLTGAEIMAERFKDADLLEIRAHVRSGLETLQHLMTQLDRDVEHTVHSLFHQMSSGSSDQDISKGRFDYRRFGGYIKGVEQFYALLSSGLEHSVST